MPVNASPPPVHASGTEMPPSAGDPEHHAAACWAAATQSLQLLQVKKVPSLPRSEQVVRPSVVQAAYERLGDSGHGTACVHVSPPPGEEDDELHPAKAARKARKARKPLTTLTRSDARSERTAEESMTTT
jgi:hypothetical protein